MKKGKMTMLALALMLLLTSCFPGIFGSGDEKGMWLSNRIFTGLVTVEEPDGRTRLEDQWACMFDASGEYMAGHMTVKGELSHTYGEKTCHIEGTVVNAGTDFVLVIDIEELPDARISYVEKMYPVKDPEYIRTVRGTLNERISE